MKEYELFCPYSYKKYIEFQRSIEIVLCYFSSDNFHYFSAPNSKLAGLKTDRPHNIGEKCQSSDASIEVFKLGCSAMLGAMTKKFTLKVNHP